MAQNTTQPPDMIPYTSAAAGHQGINTSADGTLLIKPCTQAEIDFYESAKQHPAFQAHMPIYMGHLSQADEKLQPQASILQSAQAAESSLLTPPTQGITRNGASGHRRAESGHITSEPRIKCSATKEWTPSGGAKLSSHLSIVLSNATAGFVRPNVMDLKLGSRLWDDDAPVPKRQKLDEVARTSTSGSLGFRLAGMKVYVGEDGRDVVEREVNTELENGYKTYNKFYGREGVDEKNVGKLFEGFLYSLGLQGRAVKDEEATERVEVKKILRRKLLVERLLREVSSVEYVLENEESRMYSASLLFVYEGDPDALDSVVKFKEQDGQIVGIDAVQTDEEEGDDENDNEDDDDDDDDAPPKQKLHEAVMIDFAHARWTPGQGPDENMLKGVRSIRKILEGFLDRVEDRLSQLRIVR